MAAPISGGGARGFVLFANGDLGTRELVALRLRDAGFEVATAAKLLDLADQGIYEAKRLVRNRLVLANDVAAA